MGGDDLLEVAVEPGPDARGEGDLRLQLSSVYGFLRSSRRGGVRLRGRYPPRPVSLGGEYGLLAGDRGRSYLPRSGEVSRSLLAGGGERRGEYSRGRFAGGLLVRRLNGDLERRLIGDLARSSRRGENRLAGGTYVSSLPLFAGLRDRLR
jgi:hypothetical protein